MIPENEIVEILNQKGILRFSTLMVRYHLSANAAMRVVEEYKKKGLIDSNCRPTFERKLKWKPDGEDPCYPLLITGTCQNPFCLQRRMKRKKNIIQRYCIRQMENIPMPCSRCSELSSEFIKK